MALQHFKTYHSPLYREFRSLSTTNYRGIVHFFEKNESTICKLEFDEYFELLAAYARSLFEIGEYAKYLLMSDVVIEASIENNIQFFQGEDIFYQSLFRKSAAHYHLMDFDQAEYILKELIKIDPLNKDTSQFYIACRNARKTSFLYHTRALAMLFFLLTPALIIVDLLLIQAFYPTYVELVKSLWSITFLMGIGFLIGGDFFHRLQNYLYVKKFVKKALHK